MADIAQRGNRLTKGINYAKAYVKSRSLVKDVYDAVAPKHSPGQKGKPHSSKEGRTASLGRTVRDVGKILSPERDKKFGGGRTNLLEELGRVEGERSNPNRRAEISRVHGELNRGYNKGGRVGLKKGGKPWGTGPKPGTWEFVEHQLHKPRKGKAIGGPAARAIKKGVGKALEPKGVFKKDKFKNPWEKPPQLKKSQKERREELRKKARKSGGHSKIIFHDEWDKIDPGLQKGLFKKDGGRIGFRKGGTDKKWMQKVSASIKKRGTKGKCTPITKPGCTGRAKALAKTYKKMARERKSA